MFFIAMAENKDKPKIERLYLSYRNLMFQVANDILHDHKLSEDAVSESFVRIIHNVHKIDETNVPRTRSFLVIICRNVAKDINKSRIPLHFDQEVAEQKTVEPSLSDPVDIVISRENIKKLIKIIEKLDSKYRDVFMLRRVYQFSREEIAQLLDISLETVKKRLTRAKAKILENLKKEEGSHE